MGIIRRHRTGLACALLAATMAMGCTSEEEEKVVAEATAFATAYFNLKFDEAASHCTSGSERWLAFRASNLTERDLELVRNAEEDACVASTQCEHLDDSTARVRCVVHGALVADSIGDAGSRIAAKATYLVDMQKEGRQWRVRMEAPLRSEE